MFNLFETQVGNKTNFYCVWDNDSKILYFLARQIRNYFEYCDDKAIFDHDDNRLTLSLSEFRDNIQIMVENKKITHQNITEELEIDCLKLITAKFLLDHRFIGPKKDKGKVLKSTIQKLLFQAKNTDNQTTVQKNKEPVKTNLDDYMEVIRFIDKLIKDSISPSLARISLQPLQEKYPHINMLDLYNKVV